MFKRLFWMCVGIGLGVGLSVRLTKVARRYTPESVAGRLADSLRQLGREIRTAVEEGVEAMQQREAELREQIDPGTRFAVETEPFRHN